MKGDLVVECGAAGMRDGGDLVGRHQHVGEPMRVGSTELDEISTDVVVTFEEGAPVSR